jgi:hypothetical protein
MPVIPVNRAVDKNKNNWKNGGLRRKRGRPAIGGWDGVLTYLTYVLILILGCVVLSTRIKSCPFFQKN